MSENYYADFSGATVNLPEAPTTLSVSEELQKAVSDALTVLEDRSFAGRNPELGKMVNCRVCGTRHRETDNTYREIHDESGKIGVQIMSVLRAKCAQVFTYRVGDYELFREDEKGELVPAYRTAMRPDEKPTKNQLHGAPKMANFSMPRYHPHPSKIKLQFIERTRKIFLELGFDIDEKNKELFEKNLQRARVLAARELRRERELSDREVRRRQDQSRRINKGLL